MRGLASRRLVKLVGVTVLWSQCVLATSRPIASPRVDELIQGIPPRPFQALTGSQFAESIAMLDGPQRERAILRELLDGNLPSFLRGLVPVELAGPGVNGRAMKATIFVMPDYLAIGSDIDFLRIPMNLETAIAIAARFSFVLPTRKMVDAIYRQSAYHFVPEPLVAGPSMRSTDYYRAHNDRIATQARVRGIPLGPLVSGHKKDVVLTNLLARTEGRIAIYGWHRPNGAPIQPLSTVHGVCYADYSHGIRLVSDMAIEDGTLRFVRDLLQDSRLAGALSDEGAMRPVLVGSAAPVASPHCGLGS